MTPKKPTDKIVDREIELLNKKKETMDFGFRVTLFIALGIIAIFIIFGSFFIIKAGEEGVLLTFGKASMNAYNPGLHFKFPFIQKAIKMEVRTQKYEADASAASRDLQIVTAKIATNYHLISTEVPKIYNELGLGYAERVIQPMEQEIVKATTSKFTAEELITKREDVRLEIKNIFTERLRERGIIVEEVSIINFDFSKSFNDAIEAKVTATQLKLKASMDLERIKIEKEQTITQAQAQAEALRLQRMEVTEELVRLRSIEVQSKAIDKWNGVLPQVTGGVIPFIEVTGNTK